MGNEWSIYSPSDLPAPLLGLPFEPTSFLSVFIKVLEREPYVVRLRGGGFVREWAKLYPNSGRARALSEEDIWDHHCTALAMDNSEEINAKSCSMLDSLYESVV